ncbi:MAG: Fe-S cluster assembly ATPase SufC [Legionellales bacterium]|jgi:Fe-S cluster assembly ATP-binding protein|nr:Fe-S cluster assembly ATPase SufC [Legionellales bacterium]
MLKIKDLRVSAENKDILKGLSLDVKPGEVHAIMGPNGSGKSTLSNVLAGKYGYDVSHGSACFNGEDLLDMAPEDRARKGLFLAFQYPVVIPGLNNLYFLRQAINSIRLSKNEKILDAGQCLLLAKKYLAELDLDDSFLSRNLHEGFSGGEKKRNEMLQMMMLEPQLAILDETDSGLDVDALKTVAGVVNKMRSADRSFLIITHYQRLLDYIKPDHVHILSDGKIIKSGGPELALHVESSGYVGLGES